jgi:superfamily II DNA or RNA helicase
MSDAVQPRLDQVEALTALTRAFAVHDRTQLVMACGTGKTLISRWYAQAAQADQTLVFVPSLALLAQTLREWRRVYGWPFEALVVCSDPTTSAGAAERATDDGAIADIGRPVWASVRARVTTSPVVAGRFLERKHVDRPQVVFSTYHSAPVVAAAQSHSRAVFDLVVCDEAHRLAGRPREGFRVVLDRRAIVARKRLFMTATPQVAEGAEDVVSMDDHLTFGPVAHTVSFGEAIDAGLLADYQVAVIAGRPGDIATDHRDPDTVPGALLDAIERYDIRRLLTFHGRVAKAARFAEVMDHSHSRRAGLILARSVHGTQPAAERSDTLNWLGEENLPVHQVRVVSNARCLTEGVDVPAVDGLLFADQRSSVIDIIQAIGRVLRPAPGKVRGTIIIPVTLPADGDDDTDLTLSAFAHVWAVLRGLRAHDQRLADELDRLVRTDRRHRRRVRRPTDRIEFVLPDGIDEQALQLRLVQEVGSAWERFCAAMQDWAWSHPGRRLGRNDSHRGVGIGEWAFKQRRARSHGLLPAERVRRLEEIPGWYWDRDDADWADTYSILEAFVQVHGSIADNERGESRFAGLKSRGAHRNRLGQWIATQRQLHRDGMLGQEQAERLQRLPGWRWDGGLSAEHVSMIQALRVFCEFEKHADVPEAHVEDGLPLGRWVRAIRRSRLLGDLPPALADEVHAAAPRTYKGASIFQWEQAETRWRLAYAALRQYAAREGNPVAPTAHVETIAGATINLGQWCSLQRFRYRRGELEPRYAEWLEALDGWLWEVPLGAEFGEPIDLGGWPHGTAQGIAAGCTCVECVEARRRTNREWLARRREVPDGVPAGRARHHLAQLENAGVKRSAMVAVSRVPLGVIRKVSSGEWPRIRTEHEAAILALTAADCEAVHNVTGSRGRLIAADNQRIDARPTWEILELGYQRGLQIRHDVVTRRIADAVAHLAERVGNLTAPPHSRNGYVPPLTELLTRKEAA